MKQLTLEELNTDVWVQVAAFNIVNACQEYLQMHNTAPEAKQPKPSSLWHEMQQVLSIG